MQARKEEIDNFLAKKMEHKGILSLLLSSEIEFSPLDMKEVAFDVIGSHCLDSTHVCFILTVNKKNNNFHSSHYLHVSCIFKSLEFLSKNI